MQDISSLCSVLSRTFCEIRQADRHIIHAVSASGVSTPGTIQSVMLSAAGDALMGMLSRAGAVGPAVELCREIAEQYPEASWAQRQLGFLLLKQGDHEAAVLAFQVAAFPLPRFAFGLSIDMRRHCKRSTFSGHRDRFLPLLCLNLRAP